LGFLCVFTKGINVMSSGQKSLAMEKALEILLWCYKRVTYELERVTYLTHLCGL